MFFQTLDLEVCNAGRAAATTAAGFVNISRGQAEPSRCTLSQNVNNAARIKGKCSPNDISAKIQHQ